MDMPELKPCPFSGNTQKCIPYVRMEDAEGANKELLSIVQKLEKLNDELTEKVAQLDHVTRERDALLEIVKELGECNYCKHNSYCPHTIPDCMNCKDGNCQCYSCGHQSKWQWSGVQEGE